jgi:hypothetical protein
MPKMTRAQAKKRLNEARNKIKAVYMASWDGRSGFGLVAPVNTADMSAIEKIIDKCLKRLG